MGQFFAASLGKPAVLQDNVFLDWGRQLEARKDFKPESSWSAPEAFLCILLAAACCDGPISPEEDAELRALTHRSRGLKALSPEQLDALHWMVVDRLKAGIDVALESACAALPQEARLPAFAHALDIVMIDGELRPREMNMLDLLIARMKLDPADVRRVAEVIMLKNQC